jgi:hypothetical protein
MNITLNLTEEQGTELYFALQSTISRHNNQIDEMVRKGKNATAISIFKKDRDVLQEIFESLPSSVIKI